MSRNVGRDVAPVIAAEALLRHGMHDEEVSGYLARTWSLDDFDCDAAVRAAHVLLWHEARADPTRASIPNSFSPASGRSTPGCDPARR